MPGSDQHEMDEAVHEQRENGGGMPPGPQPNSPVGERAETERAPSSGGARRQRRITKGERAAYVMKKGTHVKALLWVDSKGQKVVAHMVESNLAPNLRANVHESRRWSPQQWLDNGWRVASWFANPKTGNMQITLIRPI